MKTSRALFALLALPAFLAGCGGSSSGAGSAIGEVAGRYTGTYENTGSSPFNGTVSVTIDTDGQIIGTTTDSRFGAGTVSGSSRVSTVGRLSLGAIYVGVSPTVSTVAVVNLTRGVGGVLSGSGRESNVTVSNPVTVTLTPAP
jgi:hypothetical protein